MAVLKYSRQRKQINYLQGREDPSDCRIWSMQVSVRIFRISVLERFIGIFLLTDLGEVLKITTDGADRFDARVTPHHHFACSVWIG